MTTHYVNFDSANDNPGSNANGGTSISDAWLDLHYAMLSAQGVAAGDTILVRANKTWTRNAANWEPSIDGSAAVGHIKIIGCDSSTNDPWGDGSNVLPTVDFDGSGYRLYLLNDNYLWIERLRFLNGHSTGGLVSTRVSVCIVIKSCTFEDGYYYGFLNDIGSSVLLLDCTFTNNGEAGTAYGDLILSTGTVHCYNCTFDPFSTNRDAITVNGLLLLEKCTISNAGVGISIVFLRGAVVLRNTMFSSCTTDVEINIPTVSDGSLVYSPPRITSDGFDFDAGTLERGHQWAFQYPGEIDTDSSWARGGGAAQGLRFQSNANCQNITPLVVEYFVYAADTNSHDYVMRCQFQSGDPFAGDLDQTQLYHEIQELKNDGSIVKSTAPATTWDFDDYSTWQTMTVSHTAAAAGMLLIRIFLKAPGGTVYIDPPNNALMGYADGSPLWNITRGDATYAAAEDVENGVDRGDGVDGTLVQPAVGDVESGVQYGGGGTENTGTFGVPAVGDVESGVQFGSGGTEFTGTFTEPAVGDVESGVTYGSGGTEFTGTFGVPSESEVANEIGFGEDGTEFTGTAALVPPLSYADNVAIATLGYATMPDSASTAHDVTIEDEVHHLEDDE